MCFRPSVLFLKIKTEHICIQLLPEVSRAQEWSIRFWECSWSRIWITIRIGSGLHGFAMRVLQVSTSTTAVSTLLERLYCVLCPVEEMCLGPRTNQLRGWSGILKTRVLGCPFVATGIYFLKCKSSGRSYIIRDVPYSGCWYCMML